MQVVNLTDWSAYFALSLYIGVGFTDIPSLSPTRTLSQPSSYATIVTAAHTTISSSPVTTLSVVEYLTNSSSAVTGISGQNFSIITTAGTYANK